MRHEGDVGITLKWFLVGLALMAVAALALETAQYFNNPLVTLTLTYALPILALPAFGFLLVGVVKGLVGALDGGPVRLRG